MAGTACQEESEHLRSRRRGRGSKAEGRGVGNGDQSHPWGLWTDGINSPEDTSPPVQAKGCGAEASGGRRAAGKGRGAMRAVVGGFLHLHPPQQLVFCSFPAPVPQPGPGSRLRAWGGAPALGGEEEDGRVEDEEGGGGSPGSGNGFVSPGLGHLQSDKQLIREDKPVA